MILPRIFSNNYQAKLICILLAFGLWTYVVAGESKADIFPGKIPLEIKNAPENYIVVKDSSQVEVKVVADKGIWKKLSSQSFRASIDLAGLNQGTHEVAITAYSTVYGVQVVEIKPVKVLVSLETTANKSVKVETKIEGNAAEGMVASDIDLSQDSVDIMGPKSIIEQIDSALALVKLNNEDKDFSKNISLKSLDPNGNDYENIKFIPEEVEAKIKISRAAQSKSVGIKVNLKGVLSSGYWISEINTIPSSFNITGSSSSLSQVKYLETKEINIDGLNQNKNEKVELIVPSGLNLVDSEAKINVEIKLSQQESTRELSSGFIYNNLNSALKVANLDPASLKLLVYGPVNVFNSLDNSKIKANLDLANYNQPGSYAIDLKESFFNLPSELKVNNFLPSSIRITLENK